MVTMPRLILARRNWKPQRTAEQRGATIYIDGVGLAMDYTVTAEFAAAVRDETHGTYVTGFSFDLEAGDHTLVIKHNPITTKSIHFRGFYFIKSTKNVVEVESKADNDGDGVNDKYIMTNYLDLKFANAIVINGSTHLDTDKGVGKTERIKGSGIYHWYINRDDKTIEDKDKTITFKVNIEEAGKYEMAFHLGMKKSAVQRGAVITVDGGTGLAVDYTVTDAFAEAIADVTEGSYMYGLPVYELTAGEHTIVITYNPGCEKTMHFRDILLLKVGELTPAA